MSTENSGPAAAPPASIPEKAASPAAAASPAVKKPRKSRRIIVVAVLIVALVLLVPYVRHALHTVSTDDAYVNGYVTFVAPRVAGQVLKVDVDDNYRVKKGDVLVEIDPEPYKVQLAIKEADLVTAEANVRAQVGGLRGLRFKLEHAIEDVDNQVALLKARIAALDQSKAQAVLAKQEFDREKHLLDTKVASQEEFDVKREALDAANAGVSLALENADETRVALGLPRDPPAGKALDDVPDDIDQTFSSVREALGELMQGAAQLGVTTSSFDLKPKQVINEFLQRDASHDVDKIYAKIIPEAPALKQAQAAVDEAKLNLSYCTIYAEIDGVVTRRNVNPGDYLQVGQSLMALRSLKDIWVDANFKETQLHDLRIGQHVDLEVDMYGGKREFEGRISGFTNGTGSTLALLPAQNATGNFVKVVQRLPVRIDVLNYDADKLPLFIGLSVEPTVDLQSKPDGPNAGNFLQSLTDAAR